MAEQTVYIQPGYKKPKIFAVWRNREWEFDLKGKQTFGRPASNTLPDLQIPVSSISRDHGLFITNPQGVTVYTNHSKTNGTVINGTMMKLSSSVTLRDGDVLRIHKKSDSGILSDVIMIYSTSYAENTVWKTVALANNISSMTVGRAGKSGQFTDQSVSRKHASFVRTQKGWAVIDHNSVNGVFVNNRRVVKQAQLKPMDVIRIAGYLFIFTGKRLIYQADEGNVTIQAPPENHLPSLEIHLEKREVRQHFKKKKLLEDIHLMIPGGSLVLILGGSGAGKTTFIQAVMGYEKAKGKILYDGKDLYREYQRMKYEIGYVPQANLLRDSDSTYKTLRTALNNKLKVKTEQEKEQMLADTLSLFGLTAQKETMVGRLSGGEKKRLSTACEYITGPSLFFLDEPDSGLDASSSEQLMKELRVIADEGKIILVISHSPNRVAQYFDQVIVLAKGQQDNIGHLAFTGSVERACRFFRTSYNPADDGIKDLESIVKEINPVEEGGKGKSDFYISRFAQLRQNGRKK